MLKKGIKDDECRLTPQLEDGFTRNIVPAPLVPYPNELAVPLRLDNYANRSMCGGTFSGTTLTRQHSYAGGAIEAGVTAEQGDGDNGFARGAALGLGGCTGFFSAFSKRIL